jgi:hypothetical protein
MRPSQLLFGLVFGCLLIALGLMPGLFRRLVDSVIQGTENLRDSLTQGMLAPRRRIDFVDERAPVWLAILGAALIALTVAGHLYQ